MLRFTYLFSNFQYKFMSFLLIYFIKYHIIEIEAYLISVGIRMKQVLLVFIQIVTNLLKVRMYSFFIKVKLIPVLLTILFVDFSLDIKVK